MPAGAHAETADQLFAAGVDDQLFAAGVDDQLFAAGVDDQLFAAGVDDQLLAAGFCDQLFAADVVAAAPCACTPATELTITPAHRAVADSRMTVRRGLWFMCSSW